MPKWLVYSTLSMFSWAIWSLVSPIASRGLSGSMIQVLSSMGLVPVALLLLFSPRLRKGADFGKGFLLALATVSITAYVVADLLKSKPIYELLLERLLNEKGKSAFMGDEKDKVIMEVAVSMGSALDGKLVKDILWPEKCLLVGLKRGENEIIPKGGTRIFPGDFLIVLTGEDKAAHIKSVLLDMAVECVEGDKQ
jgi:hypothetical protein